MKSLRSEAHSLCRKRGLPILRYVLLPSAVSCVKLRFSRLPPVVAANKAELQRRLSGMS
jgi:hypothetical protein